MQGEAHSPKYPSTRARLSVLLLVLEPFTRVTSAQDYNCVSITVTEKPFPVQICLPAPSSQSQVLQLLIPQLRIRIPHKTLP